MDVGLLWYDGDPRRPLEDKIGQAARRYRDKYGRWPNTCYVHPRAVNGQAGEEFRPLNGGTPIRVLSAPNILLHHLWLGESNDQAAARHREPPN